jgi:NAD+ kinase
MIYVTKPTAEAQDLEKAVKAVLSTAEVPDMVVAIGGDGTMLKAVKEHQGKDMLFLGVAAGRLGFLQTVEVEDIPTLAQSLRNHEYSVIEAPLLVVSSGDSSMGYAFNDISIERSGSRAVRLQVTTDGSVGHFTGDGLIFATPLGSTAYNLAAGGPIIDSSARDIFVVTPNNPHVSVLYSSLQRPHVLSRGRRVSIVPEETHERPVQLVIDGQLITHTGDVLEVSLSEKTVRLVEIKPDNFHHRIQNKRLGQN